MNLNINSIIEDITHATLDNLLHSSQFRNLGLEILFKSNGYLDLEYNPTLKPTIEILNLNTKKITLGKRPLWVDELLFSKNYVSDSHFSILIRLNNSFQDSEVKIEEEQLAYLYTCDIHRDGGSYEAIWRTNYGNDWSISLLITRSTEKLDYTKKYSFLYNCKINEVNKHKPILKESQDDNEIKKKIEEWLTVTPEGQSNKDLMQNFSRFKEMYCRIPWRIH